MKKLSLFALAAAGMLFGACSSNDDVVDAVVNPAEFTNGAFIGISLQLPSADATTRANDELSNGTEDEFAVKNATLYIFKAAKNSTDFDEKATYVDYVTLGKNYEKDTQGGINPDEWGVQEKVDETKITSTYTEATLISNQLASEIKADNASDYYAYVIVNHNGQVPALTKGKTTFKEFSDTPFNQIGADIALEKKIWDSGLLMTNAPICSVPGGEKAPAEPVYTTLVKLDKDKIYGNQNDAKNNPAACVYVERAAVKITVEDGRAEKTLGGTDAPTVTLDGWKVINTEPEYYNTRHIQEAWGPYNNAATEKVSAMFRFVSLYKFEPTKGSGTHTTGYRTYFAEDLQYDKDAELENKDASDARPWITVDKNKHAYTTENTFDVDHQVWNNTTMVTLKATIGDGKTGFYTVGKGSQTMYKTLAEATAEIHNIVTNDPAVTKARQQLMDKMAKNNTDKAIAGIISVTVADGDVPTTGTNDVKFTVAPAFTIDGAAADYKGDGEAALKTALENAIKAVVETTVGEGTEAVTKTADAVLLSFYAGGVSYYNIRIKHFGDYETPWSATGSYVTGGGTTTSEIYGTDKNAAANNFLGRYGVVRDNWYKLSVDKIGKIGTAEPVDPSTTTPGTPDDEIENFISVHVHIVPWVLRQQSVQF